MLDMLRRRLAVLTALINLMPILLVANVQRADAQAFDMIDSGQSLGNGRSADVGLADLDGDGDLDAFVANSGSVSGEPDRVWINQGGSPATFVDSGQSLGNAKSQAVALGDLDGDGDVDAFVGSSFNGVDSANRVWVNDGSGVFQAHPQPLGASGTFDVALADFDQDGDLDVVAANSGSGAANTLWINQGGAQKGVEGEFIADGMLGTVAAGAVAVGDLDGDGDTDAVLGIPFGAQLANQIWVNQGGAQAGTVGVLTDSGQRLGDQRTRAVRLGDADNDGDLDLYAANSGTATEDVLWINPGPDADGNPGEFERGWTGPSRPSEDAALADFNGDGLIDIFVARLHVSARPNEVWLNDGFGGFDDSGLSLGNNRSTAVAAGDVDSDDDVDAWVANDGSSDGPEPNRLWLGANGNAADLSVVAPPPSPVLIDTADTELSAEVDIDVVNAGPDAAVDLVLLIIDETFSSDSTSTSITITDTSMNCSAQDDNVRCELASLGAGESTTSSLLLERPRANTRGVYAGHVKILGQVSSNTDDPEPRFNNERYAGFTFYDCFSGECLIENIWCSRKFQESANVDSSRLPVHGETGEGFVPDLPVYYLLRQTMNYGMSGQRLVQRYATHQAEIKTLLDSDPALMDEALSVLESLEPLLAALVIGEPDSEIVTQARIDALDAFLTNLETIGSPALAQAIAEERIEIGPLDDLVGLTAAQAAEVLIPSGVLFTDGFERPELLTE
jgi:hypothetical protein